MLKIFKGLFFLGATLIAALLLLDLLLAGVLAVDKPFETPVPGLLFLFAAGGGAVWSWRRFSRPAFHIAIGEREASARWALALLALYGFFFWRMLWPNIFKLGRYGSEGNTKGTLGRLRGDLDSVRKKTGSCPKDIREALLVPVLWDSWFSGVPHRANAAVSSFGQRGKTDSGGWGYQAGSTSSAADVLYIDCTHTDSRGTRWAAY